MGEDYSEPIRALGVPARGRAGRVVKKLIHLIWIVPAILFLAVLVRIIRAVVVFAAIENPSVEDFGPVQNWVLLGGVVFVIGLGVLPLFWFAPAMRNLVVYRRRAQAVYSTDLLCVTANSVELRDWIRRATFDRVDIGSRWNMRVFFLVASNSGLKVLAESAGVLKEFYLVPWSHVLSVEPEWRKVGQNFGWVAVLAVHDDVNYGRIPLLPAGWLNYETLSREYAQKLASLFSRRAGKPLAG